MRRRVGAGLGALCIGLSLAAPPAVAGQRHSFTSAAGFSLTYVSPWRPRGAGSDELLLLGPGRSVEGPIIGAGQGAILVRALGPASSEAAFDKLLADRGASAAAAGRRRVRAIASRGDCGDLVEVDTRDALGPGAVEVDVSFYCHAKGLAVVIQVTRHAGDPRAATYRKAALTLAGTLHIAPRQPATAPQGERDDRHPATAR